MVKAESRGQTAAPRPRVSTFSLWVWKITMKKKAMGRENCKPREKQERAIGLASSAPTSRSSWKEGWGQSHCIPLNPGGLWLLWGRTETGAGLGAGFGAGGCSPTAAGPSQERQDDALGEHCCPTTVLAQGADGPLN